MGRDATKLFNAIAPIYGLFFDFQRRWFHKVFRSVQGELDVRDHQTILDVGCGTGALCSVLSDLGLTVTGVDPAERMLKVARGRPETQGVRFLQANAIEGLPFSDKSFDLAIASYVAHGMPQPQRIRLYAEMSRVARDHVIIFDYNQNRSLLTSFVEWLERGDYFHFIKHAEKEMRECQNDMRQCFQHVRVVHVGERAAWYICTPRQPLERGMSGP